jgi:hypothetical protein
MEASSTLYSKKYFDFGDVLGFGWRTMTANFWFFVGVGIIWLLVIYLPAVINIVQEKLPLSKLAHIILNISMQILGQLVAIIVGIGLIKIALSFCDERKPSVGTLFAAVGCFWRYVGAAILYGLIVIGGLILLFVPGVIWAIKFQYCFYFVIDKGLGPIEALKASSKTTMGVKWYLFALFCVAGAINMLGFICLIVGLLATYPIVLVAQVLVYRQLLAQTPELAYLTSQSMPPEQQITAS